MKILCIGHAAYDITLKLKSYPIENKKIRLQERTVECGGGPAATGAYLLSKWKVPTSFSGVIGKDYYGEKVKKELLSVNVDLKYLQESTDIYTTCSYILANLENGSRTILTNKDPNNKLKDMKIEEDFDYLLIDGDEYETSLAYLKNHSCISMIDAGKCTKEVITLAGMVNYLVCSNDFAREYTGLPLDYNDLDSIKKVYDRLAIDFKNQTIVITLESLGSFTKINNEYKLVPAIKVKAVDSTGAGDIYHASLLYFISHGYDLLDAMELANITSGISVLRVGGRYSIPTLEEVINYVR